MALLLGVPLCLLYYVALMNPTRDDLGVVARTVFVEGVTNWNAGVRYFVPSPLLCVVVLACLIVGCSLLLIWDNKK